MPRTCGQRRGSGAVNAGPTMPPASLLRGPAASSVSGAVRGGRWNETTCTTSHTTGSATKHTTTCGRSAVPAIPESMTFWQLHGAGEDSPVYRPTSSHSNTCKTSEPRDQTRRAEAALIHCAISCSPAYCAGHFVGSYGKHSALPLTETRQHEHTTPLRVPGHNQR